jgi:DNA helicase HerA-like ATPase
MELDLANKAFCIFGLPDSGKSTLANYILTQYGAVAFVYDTLHEFPGEPFDSYTPRGRYNSAELGAVIRVAMKHYKMIIIDEANRFCPAKPAPLPQTIADLNDWRAHYGLAVGYIARRPVQLNQDLTELSHYLFIFNLKGKNDIQYLNDLAGGLGDAVSQLAQYHFMIVDPMRNYQVSPPVPADFKTNKKL